LLYRAGVVDRVLLKEENTREFNAGDGQKEATFTPVFFTSKH
jgi:hypothetical protein